MSTVPVSSLLEDLSAIDADEHTPEEWDTLIRAMRSGDTAIVSDAVAWYFLEVLPPRWMPGNGAFAFCEGDDRYTVFVPVGERWLMRTLAYGERASHVLDLRAREMRDEYEQHLRVQVPTQAGE